MTIGSSGGKSSQEYPINAGVPRGSIFGPTLFLWYINDLRNVICNITNYADDTTLYSQAFDLWQQLELGPELESDLQVTKEWGRKWLVDFNAEKTQLVLFDLSNNTGAIDVEIDGSVLEEKSYFNMLGLTFSSKLVLSFAKTASKKIEVFIHAMKFLSPEVAVYLYKSTIQPSMEYFVMCGLVLQVPSWNFYISYKNRYAGLLVLHLLPLWTLGSSSECSQLKSFFYRYYFGRC